MLSLSGSIKQKVSCLLKRCQHNCRILHLIHSVSGKSDNLPLASHNLWKQVDMPWVNINSMLLHRLCYLVNYTLFSCLYSQTFLNLCNMVRKWFLPIHTLSTQHFTQTQTLSIYDMPIMRVFTNKRSVDCCNSSNHHISELPSQRLELKHQISFAYRNDVDARAADYFWFFNLTLQSTINRPFHILGTNFDLNFFNRPCV